MNFRNISAWCIRNPVPPIVLFIALLLAGIVSFMSMSGLLFTSIDMKETMPASSRAMNRTIGGTGLRMHQAEMLRKFI